MRNLNRYAAAFLFAAAALVHADDNATSKTIDASDTAAVAAAKDSDSTILGKLEKVEWSKSGKVCNFVFENAPGFMAVSFEKSKDKMNEAFGGDFAKQLTGATVKITGKVAEYGGHDEKFKDAMQIVIKQTNQLTVVAAAATEPAATQPAAMSTGQ